MASIFIPPKCTTAERVALTLVAGEIVFDTDLGIFFTGDGTTVGGIQFTTVPGIEALIPFNKDSLVFDAETNAATLTVELVRPAMGIITNAGSFYPIAAGDITINLETGTVIDITPALSFDNVAYAAMTGTWYIAVGGGAGLNGTTPTIGENGNWYIGTEDTTKPSRGKTNYELWIDAGNTGTEADYLIWLRKDANSYEFDSADVVDGYLTFETNNGVVAVVDENGLQWELPQNAVVYAEGEATIDLRGILVMRNVAILPGTWSVMLVGGVDGQSWNVADTAYLYSTEYGAHRRLDDLYPSISVGAFGVIDCNAVRMRVKTASGVSGNIVIVPTVDGTAGTPVVIAVTGSYVYQTVSLPASVSGDLVLVRDMESEYDTIPDVTVIAQHISWRCITTIGG